MVSRALKLPPSTIPTRVGVIATYRQLDEHSNRYDETMPDTTQEEWELIFSWRCPMSRSKTLLYCLAFAFFALTGAATMISATVTASI